MSNELKWPTKPFYIQSMMDSLTWALMVDVHNGNQLKLSPLAGDLEHLWMAEPDPHGGARLRHVQSQLVLQSAVRPSQSPLIEPPAAGLTAATADSGAVQLFRVEDLGSGSVGINAFLNWEMKVNVYGSVPQGTIGMFHWDGGKPNEKWFLLEETNQVTTEEIHYDLQQATTDLSLPPAFGETINENNLHGQNPLTGHTRLGRTLTTTRSITNSTSDTKGRVISATVGIKVGFTKNFGVSASSTIEESTSSTVSLSDQKTDSTSISDEMQVEFNVPAGKNYQYRIAVYYGTFEIPYHAKMSFQSVVPGTALYHFESTGVYRGVNAIRSEVQLLDITAGPAASAPVSPNPLPPA